MEPKVEITPLNDTLYKDLSIDELEERLEMGCWDCDFCFCDCFLGTYNGVGGGCMAACGEY